VDEWLINDGVRSVDRVFQRAIDAGIQDLMSAFAEGRTPILRLNHPFHAESVMSHEVFGKK